MVLFHCFGFFGKMNTACLVASVYSNLCTFLYDGYSCTSTCQTSMNVCVCAEKLHVSCVMNESTRHY